MPRNISFSMTTRQVRNREKDVTRRLGWLKLKPGETLNACVKCMGLKPGEKIEKICQIKVVSVCRERLSVLVNSKEYGKKEAKREGFPEMNGKQFAEMFCRHMNCTISATVTRIEFEYID